MKLLSAKLKKTQLQMTGNCIGKQKNYYQRHPKPSKKKKTGDSKHAALLVGLGRAAALRTPPLRLLASLDPDL